MSRWYDKNKNKKLSLCIDLFQKLDGDSLRKITEGALSILRQKEPAILSRFQVPADIERWNKRWYDQDPNLWLFMNSLEGASPGVMKEIITYLQKQLKPLKKVPSEWKKKKKKKK